jgi:hypothetical protein
MGLCGPTQDWRARVADKLGPRAYRDRARRVMLDIGATLHEHPRVR